MFVRLEKYRGKSTRHTCPSCGRRNEFTRYVNSDGQYIADHVGKCNRLTCGYHYTRKQFFADNPQNKEAFKPKRAKKPKIYSRLEKNFSTIPDDYLFKSLAEYQNNEFTKTLLKLFPNQSGIVRDILQMYYVGSFDGLTAFWQVDKHGKIRTGKLMRYNAETLKRQFVYEWMDKETGEPQQVSMYWVHKALERKGIVKDFRLETVFFGEHLLSSFPDKKIAVVEAEKTALICAIIFRELMADYVWLAAGSSGMLQYERLARLGNLEIFLFPDANAFKLWSDKADEANKKGLSVFVSDLLETTLTVEEKVQGLDLADYLINEQRGKLRKLQADSFVETKETTDLTQDVREVLNQFGAKGWQCALVENGSELDHKPEVLTPPEIVWLITNFDGVRAILFQDWLMKNVFKQNSDLLEQFKIEVIERVGLMEDSNTPTAYLDGVLSVAWQWWLHFQPASIIENKEDLND